MTESITSAQLDAIVPPLRANVPFVPDWVIRRPRIEDRLDLGMSGLLTAVTAPTGSGKTTAVAVWAEHAQLSGGVAWLNVSDVGAESNSFWPALRCVLVDAGMQDLLPVPGSRSSEQSRYLLLAALGAALHATGPWVVVLDDYPTGPCGRLERELGIVLDHARRGVRLVVMSQSEPALPLHRYAASGELTRVAAPELAMDSREVALMLRRHGVGVIPSTVAAVEQHTAGWACGVHLCAAALRTAPNVTSALEDADAASVDFLSREFLAQVSPSVRELLVRTSIAEVVHPDLARSILGPDADTALDGCLGIRDFVDVRSDGSFRCRPALRAAAAAELSLAPPELARRSRRHAARWFATHGDIGTGVELAAAAQDWAWVTEALMASSSVPSLLAQVTRTLTRRVGLADDIEAPVALQVHLVLARLMLARLQGDPTPGGALEGEARRLLAQLPLGDLGHALSSMLDAQVGALHVSGGRLHEAVLALSRGAHAPTHSAAGSAARADCAGQLALAEAFQGDLRRAVEHAEVVLADGTSSQAGVDHAQLAMAFVHLGRLELACARQRLDAVGRAGRSVEPWLRVARQLAQARLLTSESQPDAALRCLSQAETVGGPDDRSSFMDALLAAASAEALMAAGEPRSARAVMIPHQRAVPVEAGLLAASSASELGDRDGARTALGSVVAGLASAPLEQQIDGWLLEARFADEDGRFDRSRSLVERALRLAGGEMMRRPFAGAPAWLQTLVARDVALRRGHGDLLADLLPPGSVRAGARATQGWSGDMILEALTAREKEVLGLLAEMCSTEEIAAELFLSVNTIKTYVRGILRKLCVNRRVDAVRRGRELGLC